DGDVTIGSTTNNGDGTYKATVTASKTSDQETITAKATKVDPDVSGSATLTETPAGEGFHPVSPVRILDTRDNTGTTGGALGPNSQRKVQITGTGGVPTMHVSAVVLNLTGTQPSALTYLSVFPSGSPPLISNLNLNPGETRPSLVTVPVAGDGSAQPYKTHGTVHAIFDVAGYYDDGTTVGPKGFNPVAPFRVLDTRSGGGPVGAGTANQRTVKLTGTGGAGGVPSSNVSAVVINITGTQASAATFLTAFPQNP